MFSEDFLFAFIAYVYLPAFIISLQYSTNIKNEELEYSSALGIS